MASGNPRGNPADSTHSGGLTIRESWEELLTANETAWAARRWSSILTDDELLAEMRKRFPGRDSVYFNDPRRVRSMQFPWSHRYELGPNGEVCRVTARGRIVEIGGKRRGAAAPPAPVHTAAGG